MIRLLNDKYLAGSFDGDGSFYLWVYKNTEGRYNITARATIIADKHQDVVIHMLAKEYGINIHTTKDKYSKVELHGKPALNLIERVKNHLVLKRDIAEYVYSVHGKTVDKDELDAIKDNLSYLRKTPQTKVKNHMSLPWFAGYFDTDGGLYARVPNGKQAHTRLFLTSYRFKPEGIELVKKHFGGSVYQSKRDDSYEYTLMISREKALTLLPKLMKHSLVKRDQLLLASRHYSINDTTPSEYCSMLKALKRAARND